MAEHRFNLVDEAWIPVAGHGLVSLKDVFSRRELSGFGGSALEKIALFKFLQAVAQAACTPEDDRQWHALGVDGLANACLAYLEKWHEAFWLHGDRPFLQFPQVAGAKKRAYGALMPEIASGNTTRLFHSQVEPELDDARKAMLLLVNMSCCFGGKIERGASAFKPGPALCSQGLLHTFLTGKSLLETVWLNLLTTQDIRQVLHFSEKVGTPPWEQMPTGENDSVAQRLKASLMGRLVPMARFFLLAEDGVHSAEGLQHPDYLHGNVVDPSVTGDFSKSKPKMLWANPSRRPWRAITSLLGFLKQGETSGFVCQQLKWGMARVRRYWQGEFGLWCGGIRLTNTMGEQAPKKDDDTVESEAMLQADWLDRDGSQWFDRLQQAMDGMEATGNKLYGAVCGYYKDCGDSNAADIARQATQHFWQLAERQFSALSQACAGAAGAEKSTLNKLRQLAEQCYSTACPQGTSRQIQFWAKNRRRFHYDRQAGEE